MKRITQSIKELDVDKTEIVSKNPQAGSARSQRHSQKSEYSTRSSRRSHRSEYSNRSDTAVKAAELWGKIKIHRC